MQFVVSNHQMANHTPPHLLYDTSLGPSSSSSPSLPALNTARGSSSKSQTVFRAPAHKHAHHLHSIPPREKSTRTLIIDHMLWVHGRTRFSQARAELGMTDRTGGPNSPHYSHRHRPENYDEDDEEGSEGEEVAALIARAGGPDHPHNDDEEDRLQRQDLALARSLRLRAEGLEKVITSMLEQPPPIHTKNDEDILTPPTSPKLKASNASQHYPHRLPNGVRLRLALGTLINDLFARQAPVPPYRHTMSSNAKATTPSETPSTSFSTSDLPDALTTLAPISGAFAPNAYAHPSRPIPQQQQQQPQNPSYPRITNSPSSSSSSSRHPQMNMPYPNPQHSHQHLQHPQQPPPPLVAPTKPRPSARTRSLYAVGADPSTANAPAAFRCPRHLHTGCEICVEAKSPSRQGGSARGRPAGAASSGSGRGGAAGGGGGGAGQAHARAHGITIPGGGGITGWQDGSGIGSGLLRPGVRGSALRRKVVEVDQMTGAGNTKLSVLIPRFVRLSALVAAELGRESRGEEEEEMRREMAREREREREREMSTQSSTSRMYEYALRPSSEWYMLLAGLLTRAVLEGYLSAGWTGLHAVQCLLQVGLALNEKTGTGSRYHDDDDDDDDADEFGEMDPDELPSVVEAVKILFPSLRDGAGKTKAREEEEYEVEMMERLRRFYDIPASTPDCATHMEDLAWQYPAEPVERAAVRFVEAIARWRGKPELETYKKKPTPLSDNMDIPSTPGGSSAMTIESLVHSNPTSPVMAGAASGGEGSGARRRKLKKPSIDMYFLPSLNNPSTGSVGSVTPTRSTTGHVRRQSQSQSASGEWSGMTSGMGAGGPSPRGANKRYREDDVHEAQQQGRMEGAKRHFS
ncbi:hypothetical protein BJ165DRAFT_1416868 [Panaeolus papilionaceus]|nr:hypothetical protein BJ165DRAFT_1416868 [Panaeolus papilionaceus]